MTWTNRYLSPALALLLGLLLVVFPLLLSTWIIPTWLLIVAIIVASMSLLRQYYWLLGVSLGLLAIGINAPLPYARAFPHCTYQAQVQQINYARRQHAQATLLVAKNIRCDDHKLANQTIQFWDNRYQLSNHVGKQLTLVSELHPIHARINPNVWDSEKYLMTHGIRLSAKALTIRASVPSDNVVLGLRQWLDKHIQQRLSDPQAAIIMALITGNRSGLTPANTARLQQTGSRHILAISGLHLALVGGVAWLFMQWMWGLSLGLSHRLMPIQAGAIFAFIIMTIYAVVSGFQIPVQRAWVMFSLMLFSWLWMRSLNTQSLYLAAVMVIVIDPYAVFAVGFYFSFIASYVVLWSTRLPYSPLIKVIIMQCLINSILLPITWWAFGTISLSAFFVNLLIIPWLGLWVLPWAILASLLELVSTTLATPIWMLVDKSTEAMWQVLAFFQALPLSVTTPWQPPLWAVVTAVSGLLLALFWRRKLPLLLALALLPLPSTTFPTLIIADARYTSVFVDNGVEAILINPGRYYQHRNYAKKWQHELNQRGLQLSAIILSDAKLSNISSVQWLRRQFPKVSVITLQKIDLPYEHQYCTSINLMNLQWLNHVEGDQCHSQLTWFDTSFAVFSNDTQNSVIDAQSTLTYHHKTYDAKALGAIVLTKMPNRIRLTTLRQPVRRWRLPVKIPL